MNDKRLEAMLKVKRKCRLLKLKLEEYIILKFIMFGLINNTEHISFLQDKGPR